MSSYCSLTFDDGPNLTTSIRMIEVLEKHGAVGSFFVCGKNINEETEKVMLKAQSIGCTIENHSFSHSHMTELSEFQIKNEFDMTSDMIQKVTGRRPEFFRAPYIDADDKVFSSVPVPFIEGEGCEDWLSEVDADTRYERILSTISNGSILLLHDFEGNEATVECIDRLIPVLKEKGFEFLTVPEIFKKLEVDPNRHGHQWKNICKI
ncbi:polysaccharide deacetylase family protein [Treponema sp.]|uniref:polysaccharide deacetylase family protein n=1 Tax=Treponema sp. TaxID=166 RepID=UPI001DE7DB42|nr:polysaccharide deacetylase family protein [Treponema sp.]MBS7241256.1 polysaccharide deacetylase family protein [Treponema sp.]MCI6442749.1 polysaccharide deacetylase family protein [Spirochaetia bacterium]MDY4132710.1 polysaccharide deacetylase family protein [Treponema sp.]